MGWGKQTRRRAPIVVAGFPPARSFAPLPNAGAVCRDRASSPLSSLGRSVAPPVIEQESGGVWGCRTGLSIRPLAADQPALGALPQSREKNLLVLAVRSFEQKTVVINQLNKST